MRILILAQQWDPEEGTPQRRWAALVKALVERGDQVVVLAPPPHYPGGVLTSDDPDHQVGAIAKGRHGELIWRSNFSPHDQSLWSRVLDQAVVAVSTLHLARKTIRKKRPDIILATAPPLPAAYAAAFVAVTHRIPYIIDLRDVWPDLLKYMNEWGSLTENRSKLETVFGTVFPIVAAGAGRTLTSALRHAAGISTTTPSFAELLRERGFKNVLNVRNLGAVLESPVAPIQDRAEKTLRVLYVGTIGRAQGLRSAVRAVEIARQQGVPVEMRMVGSGADLKELRELSEAQGLPIEFLGRIPHQDVAQHYEWADTSLVHLKRWTPLLFTVPSKLYESLSAGRHVCVAADGEPARIVTETGVGHAVPAMDPQALADLWEYLASNRGELEIDDQGLRWLEARETQQQNAEKFANFVERCGLSNV
ncbi:glycosyltransferase family 4 protein [Actinomyces minihominis]|uniref:glycosyltransferase family 4 protein n=1 Tax=Actinomyces minihominis TaxID=2002838 RepID=UPI000C07B670|nr:glycosyltransferase family 4 protein [Actinomyces minihominis]